MSVISLPDPGPKKVYTVIEIRDFFKDQLTHYRQPEEMNSQAWKWLTYYFSVFSELWVANKVGGYSIPFYQKWLLTPRHDFLVNLCYSEPAVDGGDLVLITQFLDDFCDLQHLVFTE